MLYQKCSTCLNEQKKWRSNKDFGLLEKNLLENHFKHRKPYKLICCTYQCCKVFTDVTDFRLHFVECVVQANKQEIEGDLAHNVRANDS
mmetsp:Transcript_28009/g.59095  ORF Transcript_28009/g.59095 Transcript_28009/m.59095 type:complete len:89 (+) Transcript_28009:95-361(+)